MNEDTDTKINLGSMRNFHPLLGSKHYHTPPYFGWELAKEVCTPEEVLSIFNAYQERVHKDRSTIQLLAGATWEEVEASAKTTGGDISDSLSFPELPEFYRLLAVKTGKTIVVGNHSYPDSGGGFNSVSETSYKPDGSMEKKDLPQI